MLLGTSIPLREAFDAALVDLDGVAYRGPEVIPTAPSALHAARESGMRIIFVTNNASREPDQVAQHLSDLGIPTSEHEVLTAAQAVARLLASELPSQARVLVVGGAGLRTAVDHAGFVRVESAKDAPDAVVQGFAPEVSWRELAEAAYAIQHGARHYASNLDLTLPNERGIAPGNGSLVGAVVNATGVTPRAAGKPEPAMFHLAAEHVGAQRPLAIGDRLDTDLKGARAANIPGLLVLTGVSRAADAVLAVPAERPSFIGEDLCCLEHAHPAPRRDGGTWVVDENSAHVDHGELVLEGPPGINRLRAACAAAWEAADRGEPIDAGTLPDLGVSSDYE
jgi:HAD superfamily hydrolase (TIGR01450 family)